MMYIHIVSGKKIRRISVKSKKLYKSPIQSQLIESLSNIIGSFGKFNFYIKLNSKTFIVKISS